MKLAAMIPISNIELIIYFLKVGKLDLAINEIVKQINNNMPTNGLRRDNNIEEIIKIINLDLRFNNAKIIRFTDEKAKPSLPIHDVQRLRVGKKIINPDRNLIFMLAFFDKFFIFEIKANVPIIPIKENMNVIE